MDNDGMACACLGLFAAWAVHNAEEPLTMSRTSAAWLARVPGWVPLPACRCCCPGSTPGGGLIHRDPSLGERRYTGDRKDSANRESPS